MTTTWKKYCENLKIYPEVGFSVDISRMNFSLNFLTEIQPRLEKAFADMAELEKGAIANPDEQRMVGHYWLRTPELAPTKELTTEITSTTKRMQQFAADIHSGKIKPEKADRFTKVLLVGIGGSALGPQLVSDCLWTKKDPMQIHFIDNTDPDGIKKILLQIGTAINSTITIVVSKSGGTLETRNGGLEVATAYKAAGLNFGKHFVAVTCPESKLDKQAISEGWLERFPMWDWVGGRTSLFSAVGLLPAVLQGIDIDAFIAGGRAMDAVTRSTDAGNNPAGIMAAMWHHAGGGVGKKDMVVLPYKDRLFLFSKYLQQLVMESLGKELDLDGKRVNQGIAVYGNKGSTDQHAYVQQLREGLNNFFVTFVEVLEDFTTASGTEKGLEVEPNITSGDFLSGFLIGTRNALYEKDRESVTITIDRLDTKALGALIALYDRTVGFYASLVNINAYHQPGVEAGKKGAARVIEIQQKVTAHLQTSKNSAQSIEEIAKAADLGGEEETIYRVLEHLAANGSCGVTRTGNRGPLEARYKIG